MHLKRLTAICLALLAIIGAVSITIPYTVAAAPNQAGNGKQGAVQQRPQRPQGDQVVIGGLVKATAEVTGQLPRAVMQQVKDGKSVQQISEAAGKTTDAVLANFDQKVDARMAQAVQSGRLPQRAADSRAAWYKQSARLQIAQPGLAPRFPGLHEVHGVMMKAITRVSGIPRADLREQLMQCKTPTEIVATKNKTGAEVVNEAMARIDIALQAAVDAGKLTTQQRDAWRAALQTAANNMVNTPGMHVAGKECAK